jgi:hypothetical protein
MSRRSMRIAGSLLKEYGVPLKAVYDEVKALARE